MNNLFKNQKAKLAILIITSILALVSVFTAIRLYQLGNRPVAPNVPESEPQAAQVPLAVTPPPAVCSTSFNVPGTPSPTPTRTPTPTPTRTPTPTPTRTPTPTPTRTPTPTPVPQCNSVCTTSAQCLNGMTCSAGRCRNVSCTSQANCVCPTPTPTPTRTPTPTPTRTPTPTPTRTPTPTPTRTPTPTPVPQCNSACTSNAQCLNGMTCSGGLCRNVSCISQSSCVCPTPTPTPHTPSPTPTTPPTPGPSAICTGLNAYDSAWNQLSASQLAGLTAGNNIEFCVAGTTTAGQFDMARFTINGVTQSETTTTRPGSNDFCQAYVIPSGVYTFNVTAQIHHVTLGWVGP